MVAWRHAYALNVLVSKHMPLDPGVLRVHVYMDESYINKNHKRDMTWYHVDEARPGEIGGKSGKGERLCFLAAITAEYGILEKSILIFKAKKSKGDYHRNMDGKVFMRWLDTQLSPALQDILCAEERGEKRRVEIVLVMDNASYHCTAQDMSDEQLVREGDPAKMKRDQLHKCLRHRNVRFNAARAGRGGGDSVAVLQEKAEQYLRTRPAERPKNQVQEWCRQQTNIQRGFHVFVENTPLYQPDLQPIELLWAMAKNAAGRLYDPDRTMEQLIVLVRDLLLRCGNQEQCARFAQHVRKFEEKYVAEARAAAEGGAAGPSSPSTHGEETDDDDADDEQGDPGQDADSDDSEDEG